MSLMDVVAVLQQMGKELRANAADAEAATKAAREYRKATAGMSEGTTGGGAGASSSSSSSAGPSGGKDKGVSGPALAAALQSLTRRTK